MDNVPKFIKNKMPHALSDDEVKQIKKLLNDGVIVKAIAMDFNRSLTSIRFIKYGYTYKDIV